MQRSALFRRWIPAMGETRLISAQGHTRSFYVAKKHATVFSRSRFPRLSAATCTISVPLPLVGSAYRKIFCCPPFFLRQHADTLYGFLPYNPGASNPGQPHANGRAFRRRYAYSSRSGVRSPISFGARCATQVRNTGSATCVSNPLFSALQPVAPEALHLAGTQLQVRPSVQTRSDATDTPAVAKTFLREARGFRSHAERRPVVGQGRVSRSRTKRSETPCSRNS